MSAISLNWKIIGDGMTSKITRKLVLYFIIVILIFSLVSGILFLSLGRKSIEDSSTKYLEDRGQRIALFISNTLESESNEEKEMLERGNIKQDINGPHERIHMKNSPGKKYLKRLNELLETDIRIVSKDDKLIEVGVDKKPVEYNSLKSYEKDIVNKAFAGQVSHISESSIFDDSISVTVAAPIRLKGKIDSAILISENNPLPGDFMNTARNIFIISTIIGAILVAILAIFFANRFIRPLNKLSLTTKELTEGNYRISTYIDQNDEIGDLAYRIDELAQRLEAARIESESMGQMRDDFISSMSHELKTPVTVVKASLEALVSGVITDTKQVDEYHQIIYNEIGFLEKLINDLMELNILRNNKFQMNIEEINIIDVLNDSIRSQSLIAREKNVTIEKKYKDNILIFSGDYTRIRQLFITIINNAIKYSDKACIVKIKQENIGDKNIVSIENTGQVIDPQNLEHIFEAFYRDKNTTQKGFGLGLAIAKEIANHHNIDIEVYSSNNITRFDLIFAKNNMQ